MLFRSVRTAYVVGAQVLCSVLFWDRHIFEFWTTSFKACWGTASAVLAAERKLLARLLERTEARPTKKTTLSVTSYRCASDADNDDAHPDKPDLGAVPLRLISWEC